MMNLYSRWIALLWLCLGQACYWESGKSIAGGGGTEGVAIEVPDSVYAFEYRTWLPSSDSTWQKPSPVHSWKRGDSLELPRGAALEIKSSLQKWIAYWGPKDRDARADLDLKSKIQGFSNRQIRVQADSISLVGTPYRANCDQGICVFEEIPQKLLAAQIFYAQGSGMWWMNDTCCQGVQIPQGSVVNVRTPVFEWGVNLSLYPSSKEIYWSGSLTQTNNWVHVDPGISNQMYLLHGLTPDGVNRGIYRYTVLLDLKADLMSGGIALQSAGKNVQNALLSISQDGYFKDYSLDFSSALRVVPGKWHRIVYTVDLLDRKKVEVWVDGWKYWSRSAGLPAGIGDWSLADANMGDNWALYQTVDGRGEQVFFNPVSGYKNGLSLSHLAVYQGVLSDAEIGSLGAVTYLP